MPGVVAAMLSYTTVPATVLATLYLRVALSAVEHTVVILLLAVRLALLPAQHNTHLLCLRFKMKVRHVVQV